MVNFTKHKWVKAICLCLVAIFFSQQLGWAEVIDLRDETKIGTSDVLLAILSGFTKALGVSSVGAMEQMLVQTYLIPKASEFIVDELNINDPILRAAIQTGISVGLGSASDLYFGDSAAAAAASGASSSIASQAWSWLNDSVFKPVSNWFSGGGGEAVADAVGKAAETATKAAGASIWKAALQKFVEGAFYGAAKAFLYKTLKKWNKEWARFLASAIGKILTHYLGQYLSQLTGILFGVNRFGITATQYDTNDTGEETGTETGEDTEGTETGADTDADTDTGTEIKYDRAALDQKLAADNADFWRAFGVSTASELVQTIGAVAGWGEEVILLSAGVSRSLVSSLLSKAEREARAKEAEALREETIKERDRQECLDEGEESRLSELGGLMATRKERGERHVEGDAEEDEINELNARIQDLDEQINQATLSGDRDNTLQGLLEQRGELLQERDRHEYLTEEEENELSTLEGLIATRKESGERHVEGDAEEAEINELNAQLGGLDYQIHQATLSDAQAMLQGLLAGAMSVLLQRISIESKSPLHGAVFNLWLSALVKWALIPVANVFGIAGNVPAEDLTNPTIGNLAPADKGGLYLAIVGASIMEANADVYSMGRATPRITEGGRFELDWKSTNDAFWIARYSDYLEDYDKYGFAGALMGQFVSAYHYQATRNMTEVMQHAFYKAGWSDVSPLNNLYTRTLRRLTNRERREALADLQAAADVLKAANDPDSELAQLADSVLNFFDLWEHIFSVEEPNDRLSELLGELQAKPKSERTDEEEKLIAALDKYLDLHQRDVTAWRYPGQSRWHILEVSFDPATLALSTDPYIQSLVAQRRRQRIESRASEKLRGDQPNIDGEIAAEEAEAGDSRASVLHYDPTLFLFSGDPVEECRRRIRERVENKYIDEALVEATAEAADEQIVRLDIFRNLAGTNRVIMDHWEVVSQGLAEPIGGTGFTPLQRPRLTFDYYQVSGTKSGLPAIIFYSNQSGIKYELVLVSGNDEIDAEGNIDLSNIDFRNYELREVGETSSDLHGPPEEGGEAVISYGFGSAPGPATTTEEGATVLGPISRDRAALLAAVQTAVDNGTLKVVSSEQTQHDGLTVPLPSAQDVSQDEWGTLYSAAEALDNSKPLTPDQVTAIFKYAQVFNQVREFYLDYLESSLGVPPERIEAARARMALNGRMNNTLGENGERSTVYVPEGATVGTNPISLSERSQATEPVSPDNPNGIEHYRSELKRTAEALGITELPDGFDNFSLNQLNNYNAQTLTPAANAATGYNEGVYKQWEAVARVIGFEGNVRDPGQQQAFQGAMDAFLEDENTSDAQKHEFNRAIADNQPTLSEPSVPSLPSPTPLNPPEYSVQVVHAWGPQTPPPSADTRAQYPNVPPDAAVTLNYFTENGGDVGKLAKYRLVIYTDAEGNNIDGTGARLEIQVQSYDGQEGWLCLQKGIDVSQGLDWNLVDPSNLDPDNGIWVFHGHKDTTTGEINTKSGYIKPK